MIMYENDTTSGNGFESGGSGNSVKTSKPLLPYILAIAASAMTVVAYFIPYVKISGFLFSRKVSVLGLVIETLNDPDSMLLLGTGVKVILYMLLAAFGLSIMAFIFAALRKMVPAIVFAVLSVLPFFMVATIPYIHYIGAAITIVAAIWYMAADKSRKKA